MTSAPDPNPPAEAVEREAFEAWARSAGFLTPRARTEFGGDYRFDTTKAAWSAWQAARATPTPPPAGDVEEEVEAVRRAILMHVHGATIEVGGRTVPGLGLCGVEKAMIDIRAALAAIRPAPDAQSGEIVRALSDEQCASIEAAAEDALAAKRAARSGERT